MSVVAAIAIVWGLAPATATNENRLTDLAGSARVISVDHMADMDAQMCQLPAPMSRAAYAVQRPTAGATTAAVEAAPRGPVRAIADPYGLFSAIAVDVANNEVILQDENHYRVLVYDRTANTPPGATMTEPKRVIAGGQTGMLLNSGMYRDPKNGDIYTVNNDSVDSTVVFSRQANGNVKPIRNLHTPHGSFNMAADEEAEELFFTVQHSHAVVVFPKRANGEDAPIRYLQGVRTRLADPHGIALDPAKGLLFVSNFGSVMTTSRDEAPNVRWDGEGKEFWPLDRTQAVPGSGRNVPPSITVYRKAASGDTAPVQVISGPKTQLNWPTGLAIDSSRGELYVANDQGDSILVFSVMADGDAAPLRVLKGQKTLLKYPNGVSLDLVNNELWVANYGNHAATVYRRDASGDTAPLRVIRSGPLNPDLPTLGNPYTVSFDTRRGEILVPN
jgi:DNA-binding beta-propeller fold protein YncE